MSLRVSAEPPSAAGAGCVPLRDLALEPSLVALIWMFATQRRLRR